MSGSVLTCDIPEDLPCGSYCFQFFVLSAHSTAHQTAELFTDLDLDLDLLYFLGSTLTSIIRFIRIYQLPIRT
jgi:hypothetical protein